MRKPEGTRFGQILCTECQASCRKQETTCWRCGSPLRDSREAQPDDRPSRPAEGLIRFADSSDDITPEPQPLQAEATPSGNLSDPPQPSPSLSNHDQPVVAQIGGTVLRADPGLPVMRLTYCKACGLQNDDDAVECRKCRTPLEVVTAGSVPEMESLPRAWGFDALGVAWLILGFAAVYSGWFLVKADPKHPGTTWADYFWTGIVVCAPGILVFMRHVFCKLLFWGMTFASALIWAVIAFLWCFIGLHITDNEQIGLIWLAVLSGLSAVSYYTVRQNDAFDFGA